MQHESNDCVHCDLFSPITIATNNRNTNTSIGKYLQKIACMYNDKVSLLDNLDE